MDKPFFSSAQTGINSFDILLMLLSMTETKIIELIIRKSVVENVLPITFLQININ